MATNANLTHTTRDLWLKTVGSQVTMKIHLTAKLLSARRVKQVAGEYIRKTMDTANAEDMAQNFDPDTDTLDSERKTFLKTVRFGWKARGHAPVVFVRLQIVIDDFTDEIALKRVIHLCHIFRLLPYRVALCFGKD